MAVVPRVVLVRRQSALQALVARHGTREAARFFLETRGQRIEPLDARHALLEEARRAALTGIPSRWRRSEVLRDDLDRFLFEPEDVVVVLGQDGLVANVAKYLDGQPVVGLNPEPERFPGVLVPHPPAAAGDLVRDAAAGRARIQARTMAEARLDDGQRLLALNEVFVGHCSHQSARYVLHAAGREEAQSSSGVIVATGTGATGWAASINRERGIELPRPDDAALAWFVREAWPSPATGATLTDGLLRSPDALAVTCRLGEGAVVFGDGIEADRLQPDWGQRVTVGVAATSLALVG